MVESCNKFESGAFRHAMIRDKISFFFQENILLIFFFLLWLESHRASHSMAHYIGQGKKLIKSHTIKSDFLDTKKKLYNERFVRRIENGFLMVIGDLKQRPSFIDGYYGCLIPINCSKKDLLQLSVHCLVQSSESIESWEKYRCNIFLQKTKSLRLIWHLEQWSWNGST